MSNFISGVYQLRKESIKDWTNKTLEDLILRVDKNKILTFLYKNWNNKTFIRKVQPVGNLYWGVTEYHKEPQWLFDVYDLDKEDYRTYAFKDIISIVSNDVSIGEDNS